MKKKIINAYIKLYIYKLCYLISPLSELREHFKRKKNKYKEIIKQKIPKLNYLEIQIVDHCNLNCKACTHYCGITDPNFIEVEQFESDMCVLSSKLDIRTIRLMGGEPLLHKDVNKIMLIARKYFPKTDLRLVSNGILLSKMEEDFWDTVRDTGIKIDMSIYPMGGSAPLKGLDAIGKHVFKYYPGDDGWIVQETALGNTWVASKFIVKMNMNGKPDDIKTAFERCPKVCKNLRNGRIYHCPEACYLDNYNKYFKKDLVVEKGIDIHEYTGEEILDYLSKPIETCKYCVFDERVKLIDWQISKKEENEWFI